MACQCQRSGSRLECVIPADTSCLEKLVNHVEAFLAGKCDDKTFFNIVLVLRESLNNAIIHGAKNDKSRSIRCSATLSRDKVSFEISSPGPGFDWREHLGKNPAGSTAQSGWGIFIISRYSDGFEYNESGSSLKFWIYLSGND